MFYPAVTAARQNTIKNKSQIVTPFSNGIKVDCFIFLHNDPPQFIIVSRNL